MSYLSSIQIKGARLMRKKSIFVLMITIALFMINCKRTGGASSVKSKLIDGVQHVCNNREYEIHAKNSDGTTRLVIHKAHEKIDLDEVTKENILQMIAPRIPLESKQQAKEQLPDKLNAIRGMAVLPDGHLAVKRITGLESVEIDVFDKEGHLLYTILPSFEIPDLRDVTMYKNTIGVISELKEKSTYVEYRVKNMKGIFN